MRRLVEGPDRHQSTLLPGTLDDWIGEKNSFARSMPISMGLI
jgi:hypothetical protein